tara:strand:+ start:2702 stop:3034 length:333 start_codon:yes stop_codon:yes gene_type:complete
MPTRLSTPQQKALLRALPKSRKDAVKYYCQSHQMKGEGFSDILKSIGSVLGPIAKEIGPTVLKEFILPFLKKKISGNGLKLSGQGCYKPMCGKGSDAMKMKMVKLRAMRK